MKKIRGVIYSEFYIIYTKIPLYKKWVVKKWSNFNGDLKAKEMWEEDTLKAARKHVGLGFALYPRNKTGELHFFEAWI